MGLFAKVVECIEAWTDAAHASIRASEACERAHRNEAWKVACEVSALSAKTVNEADLAARAEHETYMRRLREIEMEKLRNEGLSAAIETKIKELQLEAAKKVAAQPSGLGLAMLAAERDGADK